MPVVPVTAAAPRHMIVSRTSLDDAWDESVGWLIGHYLQIAIAGACGIALVAAMLGLRHLGQRLCRRAGGATHWPVIIGRVIALTRIWFMILFAAKLVDGYAASPAQVQQTVDVLFTIAAALQGALWMRELILGVIEHRAGGDDHAALGSAIGIIRLLVTAVLFALATVLILDNLGVNVTGLVAGLGVGGIAIGLAAKGIFDDLFSALSIIFDRPFTRGDAIRWDNTSGTVEAIGLKTTRVRSVTGEEVVISNTNLLNKELHNLARLDRRRIIQTLSVAAYTSPDRCARVPGIVKAVVEAQDTCRLVRCGLSDFGTSSLDFEMQYDVHSDLYDVVFDARHKVSIALLRAFDREGIDWAWPTQATIAAGADGRPGGIVPAPAVTDEHGAAVQASPPGPSATSGEIAPDC